MRRNAAGSSRSYGGKSPSAPSGPSDEAVFSVSRVNQSIARVLEEAFPAPFWVTGEVQGYDRDAAKAADRRWGQVYFELVEKEAGKDAAKASVKALLWGGQRAEIEAKLAEASDKLALRDGLQVKLLCAVDFYWPRAGLQLKVLDVDPRFTLGGMELARQALLKELKDKGLFDLNRARPLPPVPQGIGLITSEGSAAYHDFLHELRASGYSFRIFLWDARMQGAETEAGVCRGLEFLASLSEVEAVALVRGGGSRSDLIWFDQKAVALAVARCPKPVLTGIGHEIDSSVADLVAHTSRKTPTALAQFLVETAREFEAGTEATVSRIFQIAGERLREAGRTLAESVRQGRRFAGLALSRRTGELAEALRRLRLGARHELALGRERLEKTPALLARLSRERIAREGERLAAFRKECQLKDPRRLLARGYSLLLRQGRLVKSVEDAAPGQEMEAQVSDGFLSARVLSVRKGTP